MARKQYYSRLNHLINAGLVTRKSGKYFLTSSGKEVYELRILIGQAVENYWKLKAIDSIETVLSEDDLSVEEQRRIINALIERNDIKNILLNQNVPSDKDHKLLAALSNNP